MKNWLIKKLGGYTANELKNIKVKLINDVLDNPFKYRLSRTLREETLKQMGEKLDYTIEDIAWVKNDGIDIPKAYTRKSADKTNILSEKE